MSVHALCLSEAHTFSKQMVPSLTLLPGLGVEGDCHCGETVQHRSRLKIRPKPKNLRQVHLIDLEILKECNVKTGDMGENITTVGMGLLSLGKGTRLHFFPPDSPSTAGQMIDGTSELLQQPGHPVLRLEGLRNPCPQISHFRAGLQEQFIVRDEDRKIINRKAGVMTTVEEGAGGVIEVGMAIFVEPATVWEKLECV